MGASSNLDARDRAILYCLDKDARQSISSIAKQVKLSKEVVNYRIKNLMKREIVQNFCAIVDSSKLSRVIYRVYIRFQNVDVEKEKEILSFLETVRGVGSITLLEELYDVALFIWAKNIFEFKEIYEKVTNTYGVFFQKSFVTIVTQMHHFVSNYLFNTKDLTVKSIGGNFSKIDLDNLDYKILKVLSKDARMPLLTISSQIDVSPNTVKNRIKKMIKEKVIVGFKPKINPSKLGFHHYKVFLHLNNKNSEIKRKLSEFLKLNDNVVYLMEAIGRADLEFEMYVKNSAELHSHIRNLRQHFSSEIKNYRVTLVRKEYLLNYFPSLINNAKDEK